MEDEYSIYCNKCTACGYDGCCSPLMCTMNGDNCSSYLIDLHFSYRMYKDLYELMRNRGLLYDNDEDFKMIYDKNYNLSYGK